MRLLGIDLGTGSVKLVTLDADGVERAVASEPYALSSPQPGWAEIAPDTWWHALVRAAERLPADERAQVAAIGFSGQMHGVVPLDGDGRPVRPALLWPDTRAVRETDPASWPDAGRSAAANPIAPGMAGPLLRWLAAHEPHTLRAARWVVQPKDWLRIALGGDVAADPSDACATALATPDGDWDIALIDALGLPADRFAPVRASSARCGVLAANAAAALGLPAGRERHAGGGYYTMAAMQNVGLALEAVRGWLGYPRWADAYDDAFAQPASERLCFLPYLTGERSPWMNPDARGGWLGLGLGDTRGAMMRAAFEGVAFALRAGLDAIRDADRGNPVTTLRLAGGGSVDPRWRQLLADALGASLDAVDCPNAATRGAALLAGVAIGHWHEPALRTLAPAATPVAAPRDDRALAARHARFVDLYARTDAWFTTGV